MTPQVEWLSCEAPDGHRWQVLSACAERVDRVAVWIPALGVPARSYEPLARALASRGTAVVVHEWRGFGSSTLRASRRSDWAYRELLTLDIPATRRMATDHYRRTDVIGGHSLGGQLATCALAMDRQGVDALWLVASGAPYWRAFPRRVGLGLPVAYRLLAGIAQACGALPGRRLGFGGTEARSVIRDWSRTGLTGHYAAPGVGDLEPLLRGIDARVRAVLFRDDWLAPRGSLDYLVGKTSSTDMRTTVIAPDALGAAADHFAWMKAPDAVADALLA